MFGSIGGPELVLILLLALLVFGPRRLPDLGKALGRAVAEFRRATAEFKQGLENEVDLKSVRDASRALREARHELADLAAAPARVLTRELEEEEARSQPGAEPAPSPEGASGAGDEPAPPDPKLAG